MKIALIGYGKMGKLLEIKAKERNHAISKILKNENWISSCHKKIHTYISWIYLSCLIIYIIFHLLRFLKK